MIFIASYSAFSIIFWQNTHKPRRVWRKQKSKKQTENCGGKVCREDKALWDGMGESGGLWVNGETKRSGWGGVAITDPALRGSHGPLLHPTEHTGDVRRMSGRLTNITAYCVACNSFQWRVSMATERLQTWQQWGDSESHQSWTFAFSNYQADDRTVFIKSKFVIVVHKQLLNSTSHQPL